MGPATFEKKAEAIVGPASAEKKAEAIVGPAEKKAEAIPDSPKPNLASPAPAMFEPLSPPEKALGSANCR